ncbi:MAG: hypothetical protein ACOH1M_07210, partial [Rhodoglobus sp.]
LEIPESATDVAPSIMQLLRRIAAGARATTTTVVSGGSGDDTAVLAAVAGVSQQIAEFPAAPTAAQVAAEVRTTIIKD